MPQYLLSPQAQKHLKQIRDYTVKNHGEIQKKAYMKMLRDKMRLVAKKPTEGKARDDIKSGYYSIRVEKHFIYYRIRSTHVDIIDVLHESMEPHRHIAND